MVISWEEILNEDCSLFVGVWHGSKVEGWKTNVQMCRAEAKREMLKSFIFGKLIRKEKFRMKGNGLQGYSK